MNVVVCSTETEVADFSSTRISLSKKILAISTGTSGSC
jgi:hypothetical protein